MRELQKKNYGKGLKDNILQTALFILKKLKEKGKYPLYQPV